MAAGRPTKLTPEIIKQAENYCALGATDIELAEFFEVAVSTIYCWRNSSPQFSEATALGKEASNERVSRSLYSRACGYDKSGKHYPADPNSISLWLRNRDPDRWKDVKEQVQTQKFSEGDDVDSIELARRIAHFLSEGLDKTHITH